MTKKVIILNGPPASGKGVSADYITQRLTQEGITAHHKEVKEALFKAVKTTYGITESVWGTLYTRENKELPTPFLIHNGVEISPRQALINMSECVLKPLMGKDVFGLMAVNSLEDGVNVFSDGGFIEEVQCLSNAVGGGNYLLVHINRDGYDFSNDSRDYIKGFTPTIYVDNRGTEEEFLVNIFDKIEASGILGSK